MDHTYEATTVENDAEGFEALAEQIQNKSSAKAETAKDVEEKAPPKQKKEANNSKKFIFRKGDQSLELDDDYELEIMADKRPTKLTLKELKERAAGDIAVKNRMHSLAEEKKKVQGTFKEFADLAKKDPLAALEFISRKANETDSEFQYNKYLEKLAEQAEKLGQMTEEQRKAWELEKKLEKAEQDLSRKERVEAVVLRKQELLSDYPEIGDQQFASMVDAVLSNEELLEGIEDEKGVMDKVEELIQETLTQKDIMSVIRDVNPDHINDTNLIFSLSDQLRLNPDLDEEDVRDIIRELIGKKTVLQKEALQNKQMSDRERDIRTLSQKARQATPESSLRTQGASAYELLVNQLMEKKNEIRKTPLTMR